VNGHGTSGGGHGMRDWAVDCGLVERKHWMSGRFAGGGRCIRYLPYNLLFNPGLFGLPVNH
jgi:hypothetical protein